MTAYDPAAVVVNPESWVAEHAERYEASNGTEATEMSGAPCLLLDYLGRSSGIWRRTVLMYGRDGDDYLIVGSKGGAPQHPLWFPSLVAHPEVHVRVRTERFAVRAEVLSPQEKARVWPHLLEVYPSYQEYQDKTDRDIPVIRLSRI
jgi:deazaflavin-dependent oxidoreductase (nitroreductase family)